MPEKYEIEIEDTAVLVEIKQYDSAGEMVSVSTVLVPDRDAQLQNGADDAGHDCTLCGGKRVVPNGDTKILCPACTVTVQS